VADKPATFEEFVSTLSTENQQIAKTLNIALLNINPKYKSKAAWGGWQYLYNGKYSCLLVGYEDHIKLMIMRGMLLDDPNSVLEGSGVNTRHIKFRSKTDVDLSVLTVVMRQQFKLYDDGMQPEGEIK